MLTLFAFTFAKIPPETGLPGSVLAPVVPWASKLLGTSAENLPAHPKMLSAKLTCPYPDGRSEIVHTACTVSLGFSRSRAAWVEASPELEESAIRGGFDWK